ncbi:hypothetical protein BUALT_Bualt06G0090200 [Buddleja alternifolia]|uniref:Protein ABIL3 n=1 Tax=Buddleja alternifolia TaxID=168488 RepID=A0AAV6XPS4_9LAMI|nr:hypothetical protein BUALT_Bualt06G0090200 [Buddleja alternifolia]
METMTATASMPFPREPANYDEVSMQQSMLFSDSLKDLKNLRKQLYSAAEYFEMSYSNDDQKHVVVNTLKDYAIKALVNTVDHLGSVTYKVNDLLDEKVDEVSGTELRVSCIEQRLRTCQEYIDREGISQQSLVINTPKYHKRYILPVGETMDGAVRTNSKYQGCSLDDGDEWHQFKNAVRATIRETPPPSVVSKGRSPSPSPKLAEQPGKFSFSNNVQNKNMVEGVFMQSFLTIMLFVLMAQKEEPYHHTGFHFYARVPFLVNPQLQKVQIQAPLTGAGQLPQTRLSEDNCIFLNLGNQLQCGFVLEKKVRKIVNNIRAKVNVCSKLCLVDASQRKMICCILIWMNINRDRGNSEKLQGNRPQPASSPSKELYYFVFFIYIPFSP